MVSQAASRRNVTIVLRDEDVARAMAQLARGVFRAKASFSPTDTYANLLIVGYGTHGQAGGIACAPEYGCEVVGHRRSSRRPATTRVVAAGRCRD